MSNKIVAVIKRTETNEEGVEYSVLVVTENSLLRACEKYEDTVWQRIVEFGKDDRRRAAGYAFVEAAREQDAVAAKYVINGEYEEKS